MSSDCGLDIEKMSVQQIRTIIDNLSDENKSLKYQLSLMKKCFEAFVKIFNKMSDSLSEEEFKQLSGLKNQLTDICKKSSVDKQSEHNIWTQISQSSEQSVPKSCGSNQQLFKQLSDSQNQVVVELSDDSDEEVDKSPADEDKATHPSTSNSIDCTVEQLNPINDSSSEELIISNNLDSNDSIELIDISSEPVNQSKHISSGQTSAKNNLFGRHLNSDKRKEQTIPKNTKRQRADQFQHISNVYVNNIEAEVSFSVEESPPKRMAPKKTYTTIKVSKDLKISEIQTSSQTPAPEKVAIDSNCQQSNSPFKCIEKSCKETFINEISLINHTKGVHNKTVKKCVYKECRYFYSDRNEYWPHLKSVHKDQEPPFKCELNSCNKSFWTNADLNRHITQFHAINRHFKSDNNFQFNSTTLLLNTNPFNRIKFSALVHPNGMLRQTPKKQSK